MLRLVFPSSYRTLLQATRTYKSIRNHASTCTLTSSVSKEEIQRFQQDGAVCLRGQFSRQWLDKVQEGIREVYENPSEFGEKLTHQINQINDGKMVYFNDYCNWRRISQLSDFVFNSPASDIARQLMVSKQVAFYIENEFVKDPGTCYATPWHQDQAYFPIDGWQNCSFWMPMDSVSKENSIKFIKGSHRWGKWFVPKKFESNKNYNYMNENVDREYSAMVDIDSNPEKYVALSWDLEPGDCVAFNMLTVHGAGESTDEYGRQVLVTRWLGDDAVLARRPWEIAVTPPFAPERFKAGESIFQYSDHFHLFNSDR